MNSLVMTVLIKGSAKPSTVYRDFGELLLLFWFLLGCLGFLVFFFFPNCSSNTGRQEPLLSVLVEGGIYLFLSFLLSNTLVLRVEVSGRNFAVHVGALGLIPSPEN